MVSHTHTPEEQTFVLNTTETQAGTGSNMEEKFIKKALEEGAQFCDIRITEAEGNSITLKNGKVEKAVPGKAKGAFLRVLYKGVWGFSSIGELTEQSYRRALGSAMALAKSSSPLSKEKITLTPMEPLQKTSFSTPDIHPFYVDIEDKIELLKDMEKVARETRSVVSVECHYSDEDVYKQYINSEGREIETRDYLTFAQANIVAKKDAGPVGMRTRIGGAMGYEIFRKEDPLLKVRKAAESAARVCSASSPPSGVMPLIMDHDLTGVFTHEAMGHASEADGICSGESVLEGLVGKKIGSEQVSIYDDPLYESGFGSFIFDDEGIEAQKKTIIEKGVLRGYIMDREYATKLGSISNGGARAGSIGVEPLVRMSNTYMAPGDMSFEELLEPIKKGVYARGTRGGQVDPAKGSFQFSAQEAFLIENGEITIPLKDLSFSGLILETLKNIDGLGQDFALGEPGFCGKAQIVPVGDGGPHARVMNVSIGS